MDFKDRKRPHLARVDLGLPPVFLFLPIAYLLAHPRGRPGSQGFRAVSPYLYYVSMI